MKLKEFLTAPFIGIFLILGIGSSAFATGSLFSGSAAQFKGYAEIDRLIRERVAKHNGWHIGIYLGENAETPATGGLLQLLGTYSGADTNATFTNGDPNALNMILWYIAFSEFGNHVSASCVEPLPAPAMKPADKGNEASPPPPELVVNAPFLKALKPLCVWPQASAKTEAALQAFWMELMRFDAPESEYEAWRDFFLNDPHYSQASSEEVIAAMTFAALYNPYFLLGGN